MERDGDLDNIADRLAIELVPDRLGGLHGLGVERAIAEDLGALEHLGRPGIIRR
jgi:hypothetical protein